MKSPLRSLVLWTLAVWLPLVAAGYAVTRHLEREAESLIIIILIGALVLAAVCAPRALIALRERHWAVRGLWWFITALALSFISAFFADQLEMWTYGSNRNLLMLAWLLPALGLLFVWVHARRAKIRLAGFMWLLDVSATFVLTALLAWACWFAFDLHVARLEREADGRWTQIGRPPDQFFATAAQPQTQNASLVGLERDVASLGFQTVYKSDCFLSPVIPAEITDIISTKFPAGDIINLDTTSTAYLEKHAEILADIYKGVLSREPPRWLFDPQEGPALRVPNYLLLRQFAQIATADALRRMSLGDHAGAVNAIAAVQRINEGVKGNPILISQMIHVAVEALTARARCRLPAEPGGWEKLPAKAARLRDGVRCAMQIEGCVLSDFARHASLELLKPDGILTTGQRPWLMPGILKRQAARQWLRHESAISSAGDAEFVRLSLQVGHFDSPDLGEADIVATEKRFDSSTNVNFSRSWQRTNVTLVLDEQIELIRQARAWLDTDSSGVPAELASPAIPGARWRIALDRERRTLTLTMLNSPAWVTQSKVLGDGFYLLPLDGSASWQFAPKAKAVVSQR